MWRKQLVVMLNALLRRYVEGDVEGFRVSSARLHMVVQCNGPLWVLCSLKCYPAWNYISTGLALVSCEMLKYVQKLHPVTLTHAQLLPWMGKLSQCWQGAVRRLG